MATPPLTSETLIVQVPAPTDVTVNAPACAPGATLATAGLSTIAESADAVDDTAVKLAVCDGPLKATAGTLSVMVEAGTGVAVGAPVGVVVGDVPGAGTV